MTDFPDLLAALSRATSDAVAAASARVVGVTDGQRSMSGLLWGEGRIVTAEECLAADEGLSVTLPDGRTVSAELTGRDPSTDVALLAAETGAVDVPEAAEMPAVGAIALVVGRGEGPLASFGMVASVGPQWTSAAGGRIDARIGLSFVLPHRLEGGAAVDGAGRLLGLAVADPRRRGLVIPAATVDRAVATLAAQGYVGRGYLGLALQPLRRAGGGLIAVEVSDGGPAAAAGLVVGDIVTTWDGEPMRSMRGLARRLGPDAVGRDVRIGITRAGSPLEVAVTVGERRPERGRRGR
ncbi:MAG: S1C family serine protease [Amaricoccus sp.]